MRKISEGFELLSEKCSNCGKASSEIKRAWKEGFEKVDEERRRRRLRIEASWIFWRCKEGDSKMRADSRNQPILLNERLRNEVE